MSPLLLLPGSRWRLPVAMGHWRSTSDTTSPHASPPPSPDHSPMATVSTLLLSYMLLCACDNFLPSVQYFTFMHPQGDCFNLFFCYIPPPCSLSHSLLSFLYLFLLFSCLSLPPSFPDHPPCWLLLTVPTVLWTSHLHPLELALLRKRIILYSRPCILLHRLRPHSLTLLRAQYVCHVSKH